MIFSNTRRAVSSSETPGFASADWRSAGLSLKMAAGIESALPLEWSEYIRPSVDSPILLRKPARSFICI